MPENLAVEKILLFVKQLFKIEFQQRKKEIKPNQKNNILRWELNP